MPFITSPLRRWRITALLLLILSAIVVTQVTAQQDSTVSDIVDFNPADIDAAWQDWQTRYVSADGAGDAPRVRVYGGVSPNSTVSEGQAYGMLMAAIFDDQTMFDGLWLFAADHLDRNGLMDWHIGRGGNALGTGGATDGDVDMALALVIACEKAQDGRWDSSENGLDYCQTATTLINAIWEHEIDKPGNQPAAGLNDNQGYELIPGDLFNLEADFPNGLVNLSYFSPAHFRVFAQFTDNPEWDEVISRQYDLADAAEQIPGNCSSLVPNWSTYDGQVQEVPWHGATSAYFGWDGGRYAWRVALDNFWYGDERADASLNKIGGFFASVGIGNVRSQYRLNGTRVDNYPTPYFLSMATAAIWGASDPIASDCGDARGTLLTTPQQAYDTIANLGHENYYNDSWRLLTMMLLTGYFQNPLADAETPVTPSPSTPEPTDPTPIPTDSVTSTTVPTNAPTSTQASNNPPVSGCDVNVSLQSEWNAGYTAQVNIRNRASTPISGWTLSLDLAPNVTLSNAWNVETSSQSGTVLIVGAGQNHYNGVIPARGVVSFGFQVSHSGSYSVPIVLNINGTSCSGTVINPPTAQPTSVQPTTIPVQPTTQPNTPVLPATTTPVAPVVTVGCTVTFSFSNTWNTGYTASVLVRNDGTTPIRDWSLNFNLGSDVTVSNSWGSGFQTQSGSIVTMRSTGNHYNAVIQPGQQIQLGFNASHNGNFSQPTGFALNSQTC